MEVDGVLLGEADTLVLGELLTEADGDVLGEADTLTLGEVDALDRRTPPPELSLSMYMVNWWPVFRVQSE